MKQIGRYTRLAAGLLAVCLLFASCQNLPFGKEHSLPAGEFNSRGGLTDEPTNLDYDELTYTRPDFGLILEAVDRCAEYAGQSGKRAEVLGLYAQILQAYTKAETDYVLADVKASLDRSSTYYSDETVYCSEQLDTLREKLNTLTGTILQSEYGQAAGEQWGETFLKNYEDNKDSYNPELIPLYTRETELTNRYREESTSFTASIDGQDYTLDDIYAGDWPDYGAYLDALMSYYDQFNERAWNIFSALLDVRHEIEQVSGERFSDFYYTGYSRDFTPQDAAEYAAVVKKEIMPVYEWVTQKYQGALNDAIYSYSLSPDDALPVLREALDTEFAPGMTEAFDFMLDNGYYDFSSGQNKQSGAYTTTLSYYNAPFLFLCPLGDAQDVSTVFHEFGHYANMYLTPSSGWNDPFPLDLCEVHSQGLELLMFDYYDEIFEQEDVEALQLYQLYNFLYAILSGCMEDEFQQEIYARNTVTREEANALYETLYAEYFGDSSFLLGIEGFCGLLWSQIPHTFETPFYYISYAVSATAALELWELSERDRAQAVDVYNELIRSSGPSFQQTLAQCGLDDPLDGDTVARLADSIETAFIDWADDAAA